MERIATVTFTRMVKRLLGLMAVLAAMLAAAVPAFAQEEQVSATGVLQAGLPADVATNGTHSITDEPSGTVYALESEAVDLDAYVGQQVTVYGTLTPGEASSGNLGFEGNGTLPSIDVARVEPADGPPVGPSPGEAATLTFELTAKGEPPAGANFLGLVGGEGGAIRVPLTDPDGDGLYTGSTTTAELPAAYVRDGAYVTVVDDGRRAEDGGPVVIRDFGVVPVDEDRTFRARANFRGGPVSLQEPLDECLAVSENPEECEGHVTPGDSDGGSDSNSGSGNSPGGGGSGGSDADSGSSGSGGSGSGSSGNDAETSGSPSGVTSGIRGLLPSTGGGVALWVLGAGVLLVAGGLLLRRLAR